jgi:hypothetical protein
MNLCKNRQKFLPKLKVFEIGSDYWEHLTKHAPFYNQIKPYVKSFKNILTI